MIFRHESLTRRFLTLVAGLAILCACLNAQGQQLTANITLRPGIVIDPAANVAYVMTPDGVAAIELSNGSRRWISNAAAKPLAIIGSKLICQVEPKIRTNRLELAILDARQSTVILRSVAELPASVKVSIGQTLDSRFDAEAQANGNSAIIGWKYERDKSEGLVRENEALSQPDATQDSRAGTLQIDLVTGAISTALTPAMTVAASDLVSRVQSRRWILPASDARPATSGTFYQSADGRHIVESERVADDRTWAKYRWTILESGTNSGVGAVQLHFSFSPFVVRDSIVIYETTPYMRAGKKEPAMLRGVNLATGQEVWSVEVREVIHRGPFPP